MNERVRKNRLIPILCGLGAVTAAPSVLLADAGPYWRFSGVFHPAVAHFPIALLMVAALIEGVRMFRKAKVPSDAGFACLVIGAVGAVVAAVLGWANADAGGDFNGALKDVLAWHRWMGVAVALAAMVTTVIAAMARRRVDAAGVAPAGLRWASRLGIAACAGLVALVGSYGGKLTHGVDYYADAFEQLKTELNPPTPKPVAKIEKVAGNTATTDNNPSPAVVVKPTVKTDATNSDTSPSVPPAPANPDGAPANTAVAVAAPSASVDFHKQVMPIFAQHCTKCHDGNKKKGGYRIDTKELAFTAGESEESPIVAGKPDESLIVKVIEGKGEYQDEMMPPKGGPLTAEEIGIVRQWIADGAKWP